MLLPCSTPNLRRQCLHLLLGKKFLAWRIRIEVTATIRVSANNTVVGNSFSAALTIFHNRENSRKRPRLTTTKGGMLQNRELRLGRRLLRYQRQQRILRTLRILRHQRIQRILR